MIKRQNTRNSSFLIYYVEMLLVSALSDWNLYLSVVFCLCLHSFANNDRAGMLTLLLQPSGTMTNFERTGGHKRSLSVLSRKKQDCTSCEGVRREILAENSSADRALDRQHTVALLVLGFD